jgi:hypothetical protein
MDREKTVLIDYKDTMLEAEVVIRSSIVDVSFSHAFGVAYRYDEDIEAIEILTVRDYLTLTPIQVTPDIRHLVEKEVLS